MFEIGAGMKGKNEKNFEKLHYLDFSRFSIAIIVPFTKASRLKVWNGESNSKADAWFERENLTSFISRHLWFSDNTGQHW